jgi:hypothetical protein
MVGARRSVDVGTDPINLPVSEASVAQSERYELEGVVARRTDGTQRAGQGERPLRRVVCSEKSAFVSADRACGCGR